MFWLPLFWLRSQCYLNVMCLFFLSTFKIISLSLVFSSLITVRLSMVFFVFIYFVFAKIFFTCGLKSFLSFGHYIFNLFLCPIISLFFRNYSYIYIGPFSIFSLVLDILAGGFFFPLTLNLDNFHWSVFMFIDSFSYCIQSFKPSQWINEFFRFRYCLIQL